MRAAGRRLAGVQSLPFQSIAWAGGSTIHAFPTAISIIGKLTLV